MFEQYQKARTQFVQTVAELATRPQNIEILQNAGVMSLLRPLLLDIVPTIQQTAALALGRLANFNDDLAEAVVKGDILPQLVYSLAEQNVKIITFLSFSSYSLSKSIYCLFCSVSTRKLQLSSYEQWQSIHHSSPSLWWTAEHLMLSLYVWKNSILASRKQRHGLLATLRVIMRNWHSVLLTLAQYRSLCSAFRSASYFSSQL